MVMTANADERPRRDQLQVTRQGDRVLVRSRFSDQRDLVLSIGRGSNGQTNFEGAYLVDGSTPSLRERPDHATLFHNTGDDAAPWHVNGTYIGGNHGCLCVLEVTSAAHGLQKHDIGSRWNDESGQVFNLVSVVDADRLWYVSDNTGTGTIWKFNTTSTGSTLTRTSDHKVIASSKVIEMQLRPGVHRREDAFLVAQD